MGGKEGSSFVSSLYTRGSSQVHTLDTRSGWYLFSVAHDAIMRRRIQERDKANEMLEY